MNSPKMKKEAIDEGVRQKLKEFCSRTDFSNNLQNVHTPFPLVREMIEKLKENCDLSGKTICTINLEFVDVLCYDYGVPMKSIWFITDCKEKAAIAQKHKRFNGLNVVVDNYLNYNNMKFDVIVGNPPYQTKSDSDNRKTQAIWDKFVSKSITLLKEEGHLCLVHPNGWRDVAGMFEDTKTLLLSKNIKYLEMHDMNDGVKTFGVQSNYDWYVMENSPSKGNKTHIKGQDGSEYDVDISNLKFIPSRMFDKILSLIAKEGEEKVEILHSYSAYETRSCEVSPDKNNKYKYPLIYSVKMKDIPTLWYSSVNDKGHFGIPKFIWGNGVCTSIGSIVDTDGEYGLTQFGYAIADNKKNLPLIKKAFDSSEFKELMKACPNQNNNINRKVIALFRKDFWKEFVK